MAIQLSTLLGALEREESGAALTLELPDGSSVPAHFHVTEVGRVRKDFIDCGGTTRSWSRCVLQAWVGGGDVDHRLSADKLAKIIRLAAPILGDDDLEVDVEYDLGVITQLPVVAVEPVPRGGGGGGGGLRLRLGGKHTACLAPDRCGVPASESSASESSGSASRCCGSASESAPVTLGGAAMKRKRLLFVCVENANRSQMAEAFARLYGGDAVEAYSAGSRPSGVINPKAIAAMRELGYDLTRHGSKSLAEIPEDLEFDFVATMGCGDACPMVKAKRRDDWQIPDPKHMPPAEFNAVRDLIAGKVKAVVESLGVTNAQIGTKP